MTDEQTIITLDPHPTGFAVLRVVGDLDFHTSPRVGELLDAVDFGRVAGLVVDAAGLIYCDSTGISALIVACNRAQAADRSFGLAGLNEELRRLFRVTGLDDVLPFHQTVEEAVSGRKP